MFSSSRRSNGAFFFIKTIYITTIFNIERKKYTHQIRCSVEQLHINSFDEYIHGNLLINDY